MNKYERTQRIFKELSKPILTDLTLPTTPSEPEMLSESKRSDKSSKRKVKLLKVIVEVGEPEDPESDQADTIEATEDDKKHRLPREQILEIAQKLNKHLRWHCIAPLPGSSSKPRKYES